MEHVDAFIEEGIYWMALRFRPSNGHVQHVLVKLSTRAKAQHILPSLTKPPAHCLGANLITLVAPEDFIRT